MGRLKTYEESVLLHAENILTELASNYEERLLIIEACASMYSGLDINEYWLAFEEAPVNYDSLIKAGSMLFQSIEKTEIPPAMAISSLSREPITVPEKKKQGAFYTDYRLAQFIADDCEKYISSKTRVADIAVGSGILLSGIAEKYFDKFPDSYDEWISQYVFAFDLSKNALRGARTALSVHASSISAVKNMFANWMTCDSLLTSDVDGAPFDIVVGNPPWGKVKLSLHSYINSIGVHHVYGSGYDGYNEIQFRKTKQDSLEYSKALKEKYSLIGDAEPDMYMAFLQKAMSLLKHNGHLAYIVPAGLIRSQGTEPLRRYILDACSDLRYYLLDNRAHFFEIDSRFKFLIVSLNKAKQKNDCCSEFMLSNCFIKENAIHCGEWIPFRVEELEGIRADLTVPECRTTLEKKLFFKICENGHSWRDEWSADISREVDMTNSKAYFHPYKNVNDVPVIEGRMVQQFRFGAKAYVSGSGRSAKWIPSADNLHPQFYIDYNHLSNRNQERCSLFRAGYCDIAGQTNERGMMSAVIPPNVICGNKVPTILFRGSNGENYMYLWIGVTNSFVFDWLLRRVISTTVNYFLLFSMPMPNINIDSSIARSIIYKTKELSDMESEFYTGEKMAKLRAEIDVLVAQAYGLSFSDLELIMEDFPLLDRAQCSLKGEMRSTVTRDLFLSEAEKTLFVNGHKYNDRYQREKELGAKAYIPTEMAELCIERI